MGMANHSMLNKSAVKIIVIEDSYKVRRLIERLLLRQSYQVCSIESAEELQEQLTRFPANLLIVDINLPGEDGLSLTRRIRQVSPSIGIIILSANNQGKDKRIGYDSGADIYLTKPVSVDELSGAVAALSRRIHPIKVARHCFFLNRAALQIESSHGNVAISQHEYQILAAFSYAPNNTLEYWQLMELGQPSGSQFSKNALEVKIGRLRKKLYQVGLSDRVIKNLRGQGYCLNASVTVSSDGSVHS